VNLSCQTETQKSQVLILFPSSLMLPSLSSCPLLSCPQWMALLQNISQSGRSEANKEKFQRLHQMGPAASSPGKLLRQTSRLNRALTPKQLTPLATEGNKDSLSDDDNFSTATTEKQRTDTEDRSRSPSPTPPIPPPRPVSRQPLPSPPLESTDPDEIFQQAGQTLSPKLLPLTIATVLSAALDKKEPVPSESVAASSLAIHIDITQEQSGDSCNQDVAISSPNLKQLSEEQRQQEIKNRCVYRSNIRTSLSSLQGDGFTRAPRGATKDRRGATQERERSGSQVPFPPPPL
jgi:hypothetical protein